jgi:HAE1 family hydrophobic/amphiphilic exporter-1
MALGIPEYSIVWGTMAMTFVTGLCTATFLTIIIIPVEWDIIEDMKAWRSFRSDKTPAEKHPLKIQIIKLKNKNNDRNSFPGT